MESVVNILLVLAFLLVLAGMSFLFQKFPLLGKVFKGFLIVKQMIRREIRAYERASNPISYVRNRLLPWLKKGRPPDNEPYLN